MIVSLDLGQQCSRLHRIPGQLLQVTGTILVSRYTSQYIVRYPKDEFGQSCWKELMDTEFFPTLDIPPPKWDEDLLDNPHPHPTTPLSN